MSGPDHTGTSSRHFFKFKRRRVPAKDIISAINAYNNCRKYLSECLSALTQSPILKVFTSEGNVFVDWRQGNRILSNLSFLVKPKDLISIHQASFRNYNLVSRNNFRAFDRFREI